MSVSKIVDPSVLKALGGRDLTVTFDKAGRMATDSRKVFLPAEMKNTKGSENENALRGALDHETAHVLESDWETLKGIKPRLKGCLNLLEDLRIDNIRRLQGEGYAINNSALYRYLSVKMEKEFLNEGKPVRDDLLAALEMLDAVAKYANPLKSKITEKAAKMAEAALPLAFEAVNSSSTKEVFELAKILDKLWYGKEEETEEPTGKDGDNDGKEGTEEKGDKSPGKSKDKDKDKDKDDDGKSDSEKDKKESDTGDSDDSPGESEDSDKSESDDGTDGESEDSDTDDDSPGESEDSDKSESDDGTDGGATDADGDAPDGENDNPSDKGTPTTAPGGRNGVNDSKKEPIKVDVDENDDSLYKYMEPPIADIASKSNAYTYITKYDIEEPAYIDNNGKIQYTTVKDEISNLINGLKQHFISSIMTETRARFSRKQYSGKIDTRSLSTLSMDTRVFKRRAPKQDLDTAITYLIDLSGSMSGSKIRMARASAILLEEVTDRIGIPSEVLGFTTTGKYIHEVKVTRLEGLLHIIYKSFAESYNRVKYRFGNIKVKPLDPHKSYSVNNVDGEAVLWAARRLHARKEKRKLLIVLSDGDPSASCASPSLLQKHLSDSIKLVRMTGIEVYAFGLYHNPEQYYGKEYSIVMKSMDDFNIKFFKEFTRILSRGITGGNII
ncbi:cobaltochelatase CobT-related protein [Acinetobacter sp.]|uniref:cobaltochelatase CobT-related protein n=1 Tax=Acinetobacter sp. TaxID=472 RepID=UPI003D0486CE